MNILVTNDDGIDSPGILSLVKAMKKLGNVFVVAPDRQQSAVGHSLTVAIPLRVTKFHREGKMFGYAVTGTPSDCVKLAISSLLDNKPDLIISGINHGQNTSINIIYSGTVSAATEGALLGIPAIAVSLDAYSYKADCSIAAEYAVEIAMLALNHSIDSGYSSLSEGTLLNVNVPALSKNEIKGIKFTRQSKNIWEDKFEKRTDPFGWEYYWFAGEIKDKENNIETDYTALRAGYVTVTPVKFDFTNYKLLDKLRSSVL